MADTAPLVAAMTGIGLLILLYGLYLVMKLRALLETGTLKRAWDRLAVLVVFFIVGYVGYLGQTAFDIHMLDTDLIAGALFLFGAVFVAAVAYFNYEALT